MKRFPFVLLFLLIAATAFSKPFTRQDSLRGSNGRGRDWWNVRQYNLEISLDPATRTISGFNRMIFSLNTAPRDSMQIDLQDSMMIDKVYLVRMDTAAGWIFRRYDSIKTIRKEGNAWWLIHPKSRINTSDYTVYEIYFHGKPRIAKNPPWDGGLIWTTDSLGNPWTAVACQGLGASAWWPCKDIQSDEPEFGARLFYKRNAAADTDIFISNGRGWATAKTSAAGFDHHEASNPINSYDVTFYKGDYVSWTDTIIGERGQLDLTFCPLRYNEAKAREHFKVAKQMLHCFEYWMGPYPFYEDGYKLVEAPFLGMEHQSAVAYGNQYKMGYRGHDRSNTGVGLGFDFIIVHESGHEWFGNNITAADIADNWLHEGFTTYTETLFAEWIMGKEKAFEYCRGEWRNIRNDKPVIGVYGVHDDGSGDKYDKGSALVHTIRMIMNDDEQFRQLLRGLNKEFYHKTVSSAEVEAYIGNYVSFDLKPIFEQYLRTVKIPQLEYYIKDKKLYYRFTNIVDGFSLPMYVTDERITRPIVPSSAWKHTEWKGGYNVAFSKDFLYTIKE